MREWKEGEEEGLEFEREKSRVEKMKEEGEEGRKRGLNGGRGWFGERGGGLNEWWERKNAEKTPLYHQRLLYTICMQGYTGHMQQLVWQNGTKRQK
jgi:hypothetical protein